MPGQWPSIVSESLWQMPQACTFTRTWPRRRLENVLLDQLERPACLCDLYCAHLCHNT